MALHFEIVKVKGQREQETRCLAYKDDQFRGSVRVISEGVETALLVDLQAEADDVDIKRQLLSEIEKELPNRRVMAYGSFADLPVYEAAGYGRCKNAWTYFRTGFLEQDFLPPGYRYESEFLALEETPGEDPGKGLGKDPGKDPGEDSKAQQEIKKITNSAAGIVYTDDLTGVSYKEVNELLTHAFFGRPHDPEKTEKAFLSSSYRLFAFDQGRLVGAARAVTDHKRYATILNVAVEPEYQGRSIGKNLVLRLAGTIREEIIVLNTHPGAIGFYNRLEEFRRNKYVFEKFVAGPQEERKRGGNAAFRTQMFTPAGYRFPDEY